MYSVFDKLNDSIINSSSSSKDKSLRIIFCSKFKNLLDDYISNYFTKYLFYFLFIYFWIFEIVSILNTNFYLISNNVDFVLSFYKKLAFSLASYVSNDLSITSYLYSFFAFNLDVIKYIVYLLTGGNFFMITLFIISLMISLLLIEFYTHLKQVSILTLLYCYFFLSFLVFNIFKLELLSFEYSSILVVAIPFLFNITTMKKLELIDLYIIGPMIFLSFIHPIFIVLFLFSLVFLCRNTIIEIYKSEMNTLITLSEFSYALMLLFIDSFVVYYCVYLLYPVMNVTSEVFMTTLFIFLIFIFSYTYSFFVKKK